MRVRRILDGRETRRNAGPARRLLLVVASGLLIASGSAGLSIAAESDGSQLLVGRITQHYGEVNRHGKVHRGIDIAAPRGTPIGSPVDGVVVAATDLFDNQPAWGKVVVIASAGGLSVLLAHLDGYVVREGQTVRTGEVVGTVGSTGVSSGPHVHVETRRAGERFDPAEAFATLTM